jgi:hypothetical protein
LKELEVDEEVVVVDELRERRKGIATSFMHCSWQYHSDESSQFHVPGQKVIVYFHDVHHFNAA